MPTPVKCIYTDSDIPFWLQSTAYDRLTAFIAQCANAMRGLTLDEALQSSKSNAVVERILAILDELAQWIDGIPLRTDPQRFGNLAFRDWGTRVNERAVELHAGLLALAPPDAAEELLHHFKTSFGSFARIDYGSGHELSFFAYLGLLQLAQMVPSTPESTRALVSRVYLRYLQLCLQLQKVYRLEPAGSKGVWGLDDYKFISYLFGASQFLDAADPPRVSAIAKKVTASSDLAQSNFFFLSLAQIYELKSGPFFEHSPVLYNISQTVPNWTKVHTGLQKMYEKEVLEKWPVVQHFYFGTYFSWTQAETGHPLPLSPLATEGNPTNEHQSADDDSVITKAPWALDTPAPWARAAS